MHNTLNNQNHNHTFYVWLTSILFVCTLLINFSSKIVYCSLLFTFLAPTVNSIATLHGSKKAIISIILCTSASFAALYDRTYYIAGKPIGGLIAASLLAIGASLSVGLMFFLKLKPRYSFSASNGISLLLYAFVDGLIMALFFTSKFPISRVLSIFYKEVAYKYIFALGCYLLLSIVAYLSRINIKKCSISSDFTKQASS